MSLPAGDLFSPSLADFWCSEREGLDCSYSLSLRGSWLHLRDSLHAPASLAGTGHAAASAFGKRKGPTPAMQWPTLATLFDNAPPKKFQRSTRINGLQLQPHIPAEKCWNQRKFSLLA